MRRLVYSSDQLSRVKATLKQREEYMRKLEGQLFDTALPVGTTHMQAPVQARKVPQPQAQRADAQVQCDLVRGYAGAAARGAGPLPAHAASFRSEDVRQVAARLGLSDLLSSHGSDTSHGSVAPGSGKLPGSCVSDGLDVRQRARSFASRRNHEGSALRTTANTNLQAGSLKQQGSAEDHAAHVYSRHARGQEPCSATREETDARPHQAMHDSTAPRLQQAGGMACVPRVAHAYGKTACRRSDAGSASSMPAGDDEAPGAAYAPGQSSLLS